MAGNSVNQETAKQDFPTHQRNYEGFITVLKRSSIAVAIVAAIVIFIISR